MADEKQIEKVEEQKFSPEVEKKIGEATSSDEVRDIIAAQPRDDKGRFAPVTAPVVKVEEEKKVDEPTVYKDTFLIGGKEVEFTGDNPADVLKQVKVAQQAYEMGRPKEEKKVEEKTGPTKEELASLQLKAASGDAEAMSEYMVKSGALDRYLESKGIKPAEIQQVLQERASERVVKDWDGAVKDFLAESDWPGGTQNEKLLKYKLAELKDDKGQPLAYNPSKASLQAAYESLKAEGLLFAKEEAEPKAEVKTETTRTTATTAATTTTAPKRAATGSTAFGTSQESGVRRTTPATPKVPEIADNEDPREIMRKFNEAVIASGQSPNDVLRGSYSGKQ